MEANKQVLIRHQNQNVLI